MGDNFKYMVEKDKKSFFIGCEPYLNGVANLISILNPKDYERIKIYEKDVRWLLELLPMSFFSKIIILFPDPWKKRRHKKRRLFNTSNINHFLKKLKNDGEIYFGTDVEDYFYEVKDYFAKKNKDFTILNKNDFFRKPSLLYLTKYAKKSIKKGFSPLYLVVKKK